MLAVRIQDTGAFRDGDWCKPGYSRKVPSGSWDDGFFNPSQTGAGGETGSGSAAQGCRIYAERPEEDPEGMKPGKGSAEMEMTQKRTLSVPEAAEVVGISAARMYQLVKTEGFPTIRIGKRILVSSKGLDAWLEKQAEIGWTPE